MAQVGDGGVGAGPAAENGAVAEAGDEEVGAANEAAAQPMIVNAAAPAQIDGAALSVAPAEQPSCVVAVDAAPAAVAALHVNPAAVVLAQVAAVLEDPVIVNLAAPPTFNVDTILMGPLPRRSTMTCFEILPWIDADEP